MTLGTQDREDRQYIDPMRHLEVFNTEGGPIPQIPAYRSGERKLLPLQGRDVCPRRRLRVAFPESTRLKCTCQSTRLKLPGYYYLLPMFFNDSSKHRRCFFCINTALSTRPHQLPQQEIDLPFLSSQDLLHDLHIQDTSGQIFVLLR